MSEPTDYSAVEAALAAAQAESQKYQNEADGWEVKATNAQARIAELERERETIVKSIGQMWEQRNDAQAEVKEWREASEKAEKAIEAFVEDWKKRLSAATEAKNAARKERDEALELAESYRETPTSVALQPYIDRLDAARKERDNLKDCQAEFGACKPPCVKHGEEAWNRWQGLIEVTGNISCKSYEYQAEADAARKEREQVERLLEQEHEWLEESDAKLDAARCQLDAVRKARRILDDGTINKQAVITKAAYALDAVLSDASECPHSCQLETVRKALAVCIEKQRHHTLSVADLEGVLAGQGGALEKTVIYGCNTSCGYCLRCRYDAARKELDQVKAEKERRGALLRQIQAWLQNGGDLAPSEAEYVMAIDRLLAEAEERKDA